MAKLALNLLKHHLEAPVANAAVVAIQQVADAKGLFPAEPFEASVPIPAGPTPPFVIDVPEGRFTLTVRMPGGATDRKTVVVGSGDTEPVTFDTGHSARERLSWQTLAGSVPPSTSFETRGDHQEGASRSTPDRPVRRGGGGILKGARGPRSASLAAIRPMCLKGYLGFDREDVSPDTGVSLERDTFDASSASALTWRVRAGPSYPRDRGGTKRRPMVSLDGPGGRVIALLPLPWTRFLGGNDDISVVDLLLDLKREAGRAVRVTLREPEFMALLSYLGAGRMTEAAVSLGGPSLDAHVTRLIRDKIDNPLAAAGAAYVGLATTGDEAVRQEWSPWLRNLMDWFPDLPDGAILYARDRIERGRSLGDLLEAREALKVAYRRGLPLYVAGFQHLLSGLQLFADPEDTDLFDPEVRDMRRWVAQMAAKVDPTQPFTVITDPDFR
jgi:hypothetical protein